MTVATTTSRIVESLPAPPLTPLSVFAGGVLIVLGVYVAVGLVLALPLLVRMRRVDGGLAASGWGVVPLLVPGAVAVWPLLAVRVLRAGGRETFPRVEADHA